MNGPRWLRGERFERRAQFETHGSPDKVFPLLCPVREYEWIPGWKCTMHYSRSGVAEKNAVFTTARMLRARAVVWSCITYEPDSFVEYLMVSGRDGVIRLSIGLESKGEDRTEVTWEMVFTATSPIGHRVGRHQFSEAAFREMIASRKGELDHFLTTGEMIGPGSERHRVHV